MENILSVYFYIKKKGSIMINIYTTIHSDAEGNYKAKDIMSQLRDKDLGIEFPDKPPKEMCLADLKCEGLPLGYSHSEGVVWDNELRTYTERNLILCFGY